jgi:hypothetical protein
MLELLRPAASAVFFAAALLATGCRHAEGLLPSPEAMIAPGIPKQAFDRAEGVFVFVNGDAWAATPVDLETFMTPLWVTVEDRGSKAVRLTYEDFTLEMPSGRRVCPLPPFAIAGALPQPRRVQAAAVANATGFALSPFLEPYFPKLRLWYGVFPFDRKFYKSQFARWHVKLPTNDMLRLALAEGVLVPGGKVSGFLYFPAIAETGEGIVTFRAKLTEGNDGQNIAQLDIPLRPK